MEPGYTIRKAISNDIAFIADVIIAAEKSFTNTIGLAKVFELTEEETKLLIISLLKEEVDGCEFSLSSFFVALFKDIPIAALGGWLEGYYYDMPSTIIKSNLISFVFPKENILKAKEKSEIIKEIQFEREKGAYQLEYVYVDPPFRGIRIFKELIDYHIEYAKHIRPNVRKVQGQVFECNRSSIRGLESAGFKAVRRIVSLHDETINYLPSNVKILMEKPIQ